MREDAHRRLELWLTHARYEVVPMKGLDAELQNLPADLTVTVTCPTRDGIARGLAVVEKLRRMGYRAVPHLAARMVRDATHLREILTSYRAIGVEEIFVIGGDAERPQGTYSDGLALLRGVRELAEWPLKIGIPAYPEGHPKIAPARLLADLKEKALMADHMVTQICFDADAILRWLRSVREAGVGIPVFVGVPGALERRRLAQIALRIGVGDSARFLLKHADIVGAIAKADVYTPEELLAELAAKATDADGILGVHVNSFNQIGSTERWRRSHLHTSAA